MKWQRARRRILMLGVLLATWPLAAAHAETTTRVAELRSQILVHYDIVPLQQGVALVPRRPNASVRMIQIVDGVVTVDGESLTGKQLADKLGRDATLVVQASYLDRTGQHELTSPGLTSPGSSPPASAAAPEPAVSENETVMTRSNTRLGDVVRIGGGVTIPKNERVQGDVVSLFGPADIDGEVTRDVTVVMGPLSLGPNAVIGGNVAIVGGQLSRAPGATVSGKIDEVGIGDRGSRLGSVFGGRGRFRDRLDRMPNRFESVGRRFGRLAFTVARIVLLVLLGLVAVAVGRTLIERTGERAAISPVRAGLVGLLAEILFVPSLVAVVVVLAVSIVGIPFLLLVPFAIAAAMLLMLVGFAGAAHYVGERVAHRVGLGSHGAFLSLTIGVVTIAGLTLFARIVGLAGGRLIGIPFAAAGYVVEYLAWTIGFGALILTWFDRRQARPAAPDSTATV